MIKHIFLIVSTVLASRATMAQICTPDTSLKVSGFLPAQLPDAELDSFYNESISVLTFRDTFQQIGQLKLPVRVDSIKVTKITGLPPGISYKCQHPRCVYLWDTVRCVSIFGTPTKTGTFPIKIYVRAFAKLNGSASIQQNDSISRFTMTVNGLTAGIKPDSKYNGFSVHPNPAKTNIFIRGAVATSSGWKITDLSGRNTFVPQINHADSSIDIKNLKPGMYIISNGKSYQYFIKSE